MKHARTALFGSMALSALLSCGGHGASPPPLPMPTGTAENPLPPAAPKGRLWSFEHGLEGWVLDHGVKQPVCDPVTADRLRTPAGGAQVITLDPPGDYWRTSIDVGQSGKCRLDTGPKPVATALHSPDFTISARYLSFRVGGGGSSSTRVELELKNRNWTAVRSQTGSGSLSMGSVVWDTSEFRGQIARVAVIDEGRQSGGLLVDEFDATDEPPEPVPAPVWGFADLHAHPVSQLGFGGHVVAGANDGDLGVALATCAREHGTDGSGIGGRAGLLIAAFEESPYRLLGHRTTGDPSYDGWPRWFSRAHQQMYWQWIQRAWRGGLRLMVAHAVNNEQLAKFFGGKGDYGDLGVVFAQLDAMTALAEHHSDFMAIASTPAEARSIIRSGRLAVVLGVEVDSIGNCRKDGECTDSDVRSTIQKFYEHRVRHVFPVHLANNPLGGSAVYNGTFDMLTWYLTDDYQHVTSDPSVAFSFRRDEQEAQNWFVQLTLQPNLYHHTYHAPFDEYDGVSPGHVNVLGLTPLGRVAVEEMVRLGMMIDVDHMSQRARADTFAIAMQHQVPVAMGHAWFRDLGYTRDETSDPSKLKNEIMKTADEISQLHALGGPLGVITNQGDVRRVQGSGVLAECQGSSSSWLQAYAYAVERMGDSGVAMGTDFNGLAEEPIPRFGPGACLGRNKHGTQTDLPRAGDQLTMSQTIRRDADAQHGGVSYASPPLDAHKYRFLQPLADPPYTLEEQQAWIAIANFKAGTDPSKDNALVFERARVKDIVAGLRGDPGAHPTAWRRAAALVASGAPAPDAPDDVRRWFSVIDGVWRRWHEMESGNANAPLERDVVGLRDFDYNIEGLAHYGLLPDFLQDVSNQLRAGNGSVRDLGALFRSAESYIRAWERVTGAAGPSAPPEAKR